MPREGARFAGSRVLVTGGAHGIGRACARWLAGEGARVAVADLDLAAATEVVTALDSTESGGEHRGDQPAEHLAVELDVTDDDSVRAAVAAAADHLGGLDVLVNVAGGDVEHPDFEHTGDDVWAWTLELNLMSVVRCTRAAMPHLRRSTLSPAVVSVTSVNALAALGSEPYSTAKLGIVALTRNLGAELGPAGIRVNAVAPGTVRTRVWDSQEGGAERMLPLYPLGRVGEPDDIAAAVAFLASREAGWITGHTLPVDGGLLTGHRHL
ncbi:SDR family NAD(P)-dependent oxidoreductase [Pedococcus bigeumensis]|uniref:SDR family oxidoreductase n=1 Tax=Pedococcus bigeumensis TaxID=433644 RepID=A0A502CW93_9MICO|nr:SDR family oxidoreductase [Pedococcus bigeumensis]TPG16932.1 SDR family oxidoreductase [Pedococcus bigeumensis]